MSPKEVPKKIYEKYEVLGYSRILIQTAYEICSDPDNDNLMIDTMMNLQKENEFLMSSSAKPIPIGTGDDDTELNKVIMESLKTAQEQNVFVETTNPVDRKRKSGVPVGLKNIGNTCYFNSLLQIYFMYPQFVKGILEFKEPKKLAVDDSCPEKARILASIKLVKSLQLLFGMMIYSKKKYADPSAVLNSMVDDFGKVIPIGDQQDIVEFNVNFLARIEEGLLQQDSMKSSMAIEEEHKKPEGKFSSGSKSERLTIGSGLKVNDDKSKILLMSNDNHMVFKLFFGKTLRYLTYTEEQLITDQLGEEPFNMIILDLKYKNLYSSWEESLFETIEDFKNNKGEIVPASKSSFIKSPPGTLFFQLQRVVFDKQKGSSTKINDKFTFEKEIYIDRVLDENKEVYVKIREKVQKLKARMQCYEEALKKIKNFNNSEINLLSILTQSKDFLTSQKEKPMDLEGNMELEKPTYMGASNPHELNSFVDILEKYRAGIEKRVNEFENQLNGLNQEIEDSYAGLRKIKYRLLSIMMHEGNAEYGHYYSYIYDFQQGVWRKYNDTNVTQVNEDDLIKEAYGGTNHLNAYCLIYVMDELAMQSESKLPLRLSSSFEDGTVNDFYTEMLAQTDILKEIETDNMKFIQEVEEYTVRMKIKTIFEDYQREFQYINEIERKLKEKQEKSENKKISINPILNFCIFLRFHPKNKDKKLENLIHWCILNHCFSMSCPDLVSLEHFHNFPVIWQDRINEQLKKLNSLNKFKGVDLNIDHGEYASLIHEYVELTCFVSISTYFLKKAVEGNFKESLFAAVNLRKNLEGSNNVFFSKVESEFIKIIALFFCTQLHEALKTENFNELKTYYYLLNFVASQEITEKELQFQLKVWLTDILGFASKYTKNEEVLADSQNYLNDFGKATISMEELGIIEPKDFSIMLNLNASENDPHKIDTFKETDQLVDNFYSNFKTFQGKFDKWCQAIKAIKNSKIPLMKNDLERLGIF